MSPDEIRQRLMAVARQWYERRSYGRITSHASVNGCGQQFHSAAAALVRGTPSDEVRRCRDAIPATFRKVSAEADERASRILSGVWGMLGYDFDLTGGVDWHRDPRTGHEFPRTFYADVPLHQDDDDGIDVKYVWELGRHQFLPELARDWLFSGNDEAPDQARRLLLSWIEQNPVYEGVHWTSGLEVAVRAISWIWTLATLQDWDGWQDGDLDQIATSLAEHATYLEHHFSFYSSPYNHLVGEATGLYLISRVLNQLPQATAWRRKSRQVLEEHGPRQFYNDGFCVEQATGYHYFSLGFLSMAIVAARQEDAPLIKLEPVVHRAFRTGILFQQPDGRWPAIGDVDSARAIPVHHDDFWDFSSLCSLAAVLFEDPQLKRPDALSGEELYWLLGCDGIEQWNSLPVSEPDGFSVLPESGYAIGRKDGDWLCFDAGPIAHGLYPDSTPSTAHGHLDSLQVLYCHNGQPVLIDPGMPFYFQDREWVRHFRSATAHNSIRVDGVEFARDAGRLAWSHATDARLSEAKTEGGVWLAHGHVGAGRSVTIDRYLLCVPGDGLWIADRIRSEHPRSVSWHWQLPAGNSAEPAEISDTECRIQADSFQIVASADTPHLQCSLQESESGSPIAWTSDGYGRQASATSVEIRQDGVTELLLLTGFTSEQQDVEVTIAGGSVRCSTVESVGQAGRVESFQSAQCGDNVTWRFRSRCGHARRATIERSSDSVSVPELAEEQYDWFVRNKD